ncbi:NAD-dependent epimerase/dehydratase family protein [Agromyces sp. CFH 90414]|uniref:NAD-dependent epimerase/dehydratase family protein n=1 Tax=Agromyces agglutinans TaxID=2662258 RepID=A0A6I2F8A1_9MICO|nr:NAD-dependent epimerase/dehydratase family protein [Agromyces agglutinans]MRG60839.1 NAD-dependent epimerase/dehydratase family protein [Agromyces agglutinans]
MRIAVTGASGFIGGAIATALADDGHRVVGYGRRPVGWSHPSGTYRVWDLARGPLREPDRVDAVVHCAGLSDPWAGFERALLANRGGTRSVVRTFPGRRIVHVSTSAVYDAASASVQVAEDARMPERHLSAYAATKALAEAELGGRDAVILRPHLVYGPGDPALLRRLLAGIRGGRLLLPAAAEVPHALTHIDNLVDAVRRAAIPFGPRGTFNVTDASPVLLSDAIGELLERRRVEARIVGIPTPAALRIAHALERTARLTGTRPVLTRDTVSRLGYERTFDLAAAREHLDYRPRETSFEGAEHW